MSFTPTQRKILHLLADGMPHRPQELHRCLYDDLADLRAVRYHLSQLRKKLRPEGQDIVCEIWQRTVHYRWVKLIGAAR